MTSKNIRLLKKAIFNKLNSDTQLRTLLGGEGKIVSSQPLKETKYPCVVYSIVTDTDFPYNETKEGSNITQTWFRVTVFSKDSKTEESDNIEERIKALLHGQRTLDTDEIICYSCFRDNRLETMRDPDLRTWITPTRYKISWGVK